jgi:glycosyltransferase involved in cell wall biosynthesis
MRILHVIRSLHKAGAEKLCVDICLALHQRTDIEVLLVSMSPINDFEKLTKNLPLRIINSKVFPSILKKNVVDIKEFEAVVNEFKPDIIHSHLFWSELLSRHKIFPNIQYVTHCHDNMVELNKFSSQVLFTKSKFTCFFERIWIMKRYKRCANNFLTISKDTQEYFIKILPDSLKSNVKLLPNAIDYKTYERPVNLHEKSQNTLKLINIGRFATYKNQQFLIDVFEILSNKISNIELHFCGEGECWEEVKKKAVPFKNRIFFHGNVDNIPERLWDTDLYVHSAYYEPYGLVLLEAMAAGLPVITLDGKGNRDLIEQGENGFLLAEQNANQFAELIIKLWSDKQLYHKMASNAVDFARKYDISEYTDKLVDYYKQLLN